MKKISLYINKVNEPVDGYEPIDIRTVEILQDIPNNSCNKIIIQDTLDYVADKSILQLAISKLAYEGEFILIGTDLRTVCYEFAHYKIDVNTIHHFLYENKINIGTVEDYTTLLIAHGLHIIKNILDDYRYTIVAVRNAN